MWWLWLGLAWADCNQVLAISLNQAERAYLGGQTQALDDAVKEARKALSCASEVVEPNESARLHRAEALLAEARGNKARAHDLLRAMVQADPYLGIEDLAPHDDPLWHRVVSAEEAGPGPAQDVPWPSEGSVYVNGLASALAPTEHPWIHQHVRTEGKVLATSWVDSGAVAPAIQERRRRGGAWTWAGLGTGLAAGALYGAAWSQRARYDAAVTAQDSDAIRGAHTTTNALSIASVATGSVGATFLVIGVTR